MGDRTGCIPILRVARAQPAPLAKSSLEDYKSGMHSIELMFQDNLRFDIDVSVNLIIAA
jgi:hypothetical protein